MFVCICFFEPPSGMSHVLLLICIAQDIPKEVLKEEIAAGSCTELSKLVLGLKTHLVQLQGYIECMVKQWSPPSLRKTSEKKKRWERRIAGLFWFRNLTPGQVGVSSIRAEQNRKLYRAI